MSARRGPTYPGVYPRAYGETQRLPTPDGDKWGLSPRLRGNPWDVRRDTRRFGSIPALTGKPPACRSRLYWTGVYPRAYGETVQRTSRQGDRRGLSPRLRGNRKQQPRPYRGRGSIPALTGKPSAGGGYHALRGSIPALTGKPRSRRAAPSACRVYPRAYGETQIEARGALGMSGLSPRLRGNPDRGARRPRHVGSIPALTGKPVGGGGSFSVAEVYPRAYGETDLVNRSVPIAVGLSPRLRGNPNALISQPTGRRSIPALTGKPL